MAAAYAVVEKRGEKRKKKKRVAVTGFDPATSGLWAQHASAAPHCFVGEEREESAEGEKGESEKQGRSEEVGKGGKSSPYCL